MPWGTLLVMVGASLAVALFVAWPLLTGKAEPDVRESETPVDHLLVQKELVYSAIKELEFDHAMGNLSDTDYRELSRRYDDRAVALLQSIDEVSQADEDAVAGENPMMGGAMGSRSRPARAEDAIEQEIAALRAKRRAKDGGTFGRNLGDEIETQVAALRTARQQEVSAAALVSSPGIPGSPRATCPACSAQIKDSGAAFCARCGTSLRAPCPACGVAVEADDAFCSACGAQLGRGGEQAEVTAQGGANA